MLPTMRLLVLGTVSLLPSCTISMWGSSQSPKAHLRREVSSVHAVTILAGHQRNSLQLDRREHLTAPDASTQQPTSWRLTPRKHAAIARMLLEHPGLFSLQQASLAADYAAYEKLLLSNEAELILRGTISLANCEVALGQPKPAPFATLPQAAGIVAQLELSRSQSFAADRIVALPEPLRECTLRLLELRCPELDGALVTAFAWVHSDSSDGSDGSARHHPDDDPRLKQLAAYDVLLRFAGIPQAHRLRSDLLFLATEVGGFGVITHRSTWQFEPVPLERPTEAPSTNHADHSRVLCTGSLSLRERWYQPGPGWDMPVWQKAVATPFTLTADTIYLPLAAVPIGILGLYLWACSYATPTTQGI